MVGLSMTKLIFTWKFIAALPISRHKAQYESVSYSTLSIKLDQKPKKTTVFTQRGMRQVKYFLVEGTVVATLFDLLKLV